MSLAYEIVFQMHKNKHFGKRKIPPPKKQSNGMNKGNLQKT